MPSGKRGGCFLDGYQAIQPHHAYLLDRHRQGQSRHDIIRRVHFCISCGNAFWSAKPRAIEIIDELEPADRGIYGGTVGYFDFSGNLDMAIAIRTAFIRDHEASVQAGAGIVLDSVPASEWQETRNKAEASVEAVQIASQLRQL